MIKHLLIGSLVLFSGAANASPTVMALFNAIKATGTTVALDLPSVCKDRQVMGMYEYQHKVLDRLTICVANHNGNSAELRDTVLHESVHVAQACYGKHLFTTESIVSVSNPKEVLFVSQSYPRNQVARELEARVIAREQDEVYVTNLIKEHCK